MALNKITNRIFILAVIAIFSYNYATAQTLNPQDSAWIKDNYINYAWFINGTKIK